MLKKQLRRDQVAAFFVLRLIEDALQWLVLLARSDESVRAENLVLRRQLAMFVERGTQPRRRMPQPESVWPS